MKTNTLIGDSGGTSTNWYRIDALGNEHYFETESYHPVNFNSAFFEQMQQFWAKQDFGLTNLYFYGAGCGSEVNQKILSAHFQSVGFSVNELESDVLGACKAYFGKNNGSLAIMGTGSVLVHYENGEIVQQIGGLGHLIGDEGSGYYFGKLILNHWLNGELSASLSQQMQKEFGDRAEVLKQIYAPTGKKWVSELALQTADYIESKEISRFHEENIRHFCLTHLTQLSITIEPLVIIGGYAHAQKELLQNILREQLIFDFTIEKSPLKKMVNRVSKLYG